LIPNLGIVISFDLSFLIQHFVSFNKALQFGKERQIVQNLFLGSANVGNAFRPQVVFNRKILKVPVQMRQ
jgi:hypothetical protein